MIAQEHIFRDLSSTYSFIWTAIPLSLFSVGVVSYYYTQKNSVLLTEYNKKLRDYNHYLAHEIKTPISVIHSSLDVLKFDYSALRVSQTQQELRNITRIVDGLLAFSESLQIGNKKHLNLENFIRTSMEGALNNGCSIQIINQEFNLSLHTDELLFGRIIKNIIENACKYSTDATLIIHISKSSILFRNKTEATLSQEEIGRLMGQFYSRPLNNHKGNGLGLPMIQEIVKVLGYRMSVSSVENTFQVEIFFQ